MGRIPSLAPTRATLTLHTSTSTSSSTSSHLSLPLSKGQVRNATFVPRPRRPYTFTQMIQLSDGSSYTVRTTSPQPLYRATKDSRNTLLWQPSEKSLKNVELDEAGKLAAFRERFGRAFDQTAAAGEEGAEAEAGKDAAAAEQAVDDTYGDLISSYAPDRSSEMKESVTAPAPTKKKK